MRQVSEHPAPHAASYGTASCRDNLYRLPFPSPTLDSITNIVWLSVCLTHFNDSISNFLKLQFFFREVFWKTTHFCSPYFHFSAKHDKHKHWKIDVFSLRSSFFELFLFSATSILEATTLCLGTQFLKIYVLDATYRPTRKYLIH